MASVGSQGKRAATLVYGIGKKRLDTGARLYCVTRPNIGRSAKLETLDEISKRYKPATPEQAEKIWKEQYEGPFMLGILMVPKFHSECLSCLCLVFIVKLMLRTIYYICIRTVC